MVQEAGPLTLAAGNAGLSRWLESRDRELQDARVYESFPPAPAKQLPSIQDYLNGKRDGAA